MTPDLNLLRNNVEKLNEIIDYLELELTDNLRWEEPSDVSYLNERDWADPDIVANVKAMNETNRLISWIGQDFEGYIGLWHGPDNIEINNAPVVRLDTEGQYSIIAKTIPNYLIVSCDADAFLHNRELLVSVGFNVSESISEIWNSIDVIYHSVNEYRNALYYREKKDRVIKSKTD